MGRVERKDVDRAGRAVTVQRRYADGRLPAYPKTERSRRRVPLTQRALDAAGIARRGPYALRHTFATEALAAGVSIFELARLMGTSVAMIDRTYGHLATDTDERIRARLDGRSERSGEEMVSASE
jgi:integrase